MTTTKLIPRFSDDIYAVEMEAELRKARDEETAEFMAESIFDSKNMGMYEKIGWEIGLLVDIKNRAYGNSIHDSGYMLRKLYPNGIRPDQYDDMLAIVRIIDKLFRIANAKNALGENPFQDIAGYGILKCRE